MIPPSKLVERLLSGKPTPLEREAAEALVQAQERTKHWKDKCHKAWDERDEQQMQRMQADTALAQSQKEVAELREDAAILLKYVGKSLVDDGVAWNERAGAISRLQSALKEPRR